MTTCPARTLVGDDQGQPKPASKQAPRCWLAGIKRASPVTCWRASWWLLQAFSDLEASLYTPCLPRDHDVNTTLHCTFLTLRIRTPLTLPLHTIYTRSYRHTNLPAIQDSRHGLSSLIHRLPRQQLTSGRLHHFLPSQREPVPIRASARHTSPPPRIHLTATHNTLRQPACSLYVTA
jgi:hypothetical protein